MVRRHAVLSKAYAAGQRSYRCTPPTHTRSCLLPPSNCSRPPPAPSSLTTRRRRIARGSGRTEEQVAELIGMFTSMRAQMQTLSRMMALSGGAQGEACC